MIHRVMLVARDQPVAAGRVRVELAAGLHGEVSCLLHRFDRHVSCRLDHDATLTAHPGNNGGPSIDMFRLEEVVKMRHHRMAKSLLSSRIRLKTESEILSSRLSFQTATNREKLSDLFSSQRS